MILADKIMPLPRLDETLADNGGSTYAERMARQNAIKKTQSDAAAAHKLEMQGQKMPPETHRDETVKVRKVNSEDESDPVRIDIPEDMDEGRTLEDLRRILTRYPGETPVVIVSKGSGRKFTTNRELWVSATEGFYEEISGLLN